MEAELIVAIKVERDRFKMENFIGSEPILALVARGSFLMEREGRRQIICSHEAVLFRPNILYQRKVLEPLTMYLFRFKGESPFLSDHVIFRNKERLATTLQMLHILDQGVYKEDFSYRSHLFQDLLLQYTLENQEELQGDRVIERAVFRIHRNIHKRTNLKEIGEESGLSYVQFLRRFQRQMGMSPSEYLAALRLQKAKKLLAEGDLLIKEIANACGFEDEYYFSNFFKKHTGLSPSSYRSSLSS